MSKIELKKQTKKKKKELAMEKLKHKGYGEFFGHTYDPNDQTTFPAVIDAILKKKSVIRGGLYLKNQISIASVMPILGLHADKIMGSRGLPLLVAFTDSDHRLSAMYNYEFVACVTGGTDVNGLAIILVLMNVLEANGRKECPFMALEEKEVQELSVMFEFAIFSIVLLFIFDV